MDGDLSTNIPWIFFPCGSALYTLHCRRMIAACTEEAEIYCGICMGKIRISEIILPPSSATVRYNSCARGIARVFAFILSFPCVLIVSTNSLKYIANNKIPDIILKSYESFCIIPVLHSVGFFHYIYHI